MRERILRPFTGLGLYAAGAVVCAFFGTALLVATLVGPGAILWTGHALRATEQSGIITYTYNGVAHTMDDPGSFATRTLTVYIDPSNPDTAVVDTTAKRATDVLFVLGPYVIAAAFLVGGTLHRRRVRSGLDSDRAGQKGELFGHGLDRDVVARLLHGSPPPGP